MNKHARGELVHRRAARITHTFARKPSGYVPEHTTYCRRHPRAERRLVALTVSGITCPCSALEVWGYSRSSGPAHQADNDAIWIFRVKDNAGGVLEHAVRQRMRFEAHDGTLISQS